MGNEPGLQQNMDSLSCAESVFLLDKFALHQRRLVGRATALGESLHADVARPIVPMGIGQAKYILVAVDELTRYAWAFPMRTKAKTARLLALLIQRINTQVRRTGKSGVRRLRSDQGGEFKSYSLE